MKGNNKFKRITVCTLIALIVVSTVIGFLCSKTGIWTSGKLQTNQGLTTIKELSDGTEIVNKPIIQNRDLLDPSKANEVGLTNKDIIKKAAELLGKRYLFGAKGASNAYGKSSATLYTKDKINSIDCAGLPYWALSSLGVKTSGFTFQNPVPVDTEHYFEYTSKGYSRYYKEAGSWKKEKYTKEDGSSSMRWVWYSTNSSGDSITAHASQLKFSGNNNVDRLVNVFKINDPITSDLRYYEYYDYNEDTQEATKKELPSGTVITSYGAAYGKKNHTWIYIGDLGSAKIDDVKVILKNEYGIDVDEIKKQTGKTVIFSESDTNTHWKIEASSTHDNSADGWVGVTINNGDPNLLDDDGSKKVGPIWAYQFGVDTSTTNSGEYSLDITKKERKDGAISQEDNSTLADAKFKVELQKNNSTDKKEYTLTSLKEGGSKIETPEESKDENGIKVGIDDIKKDDIYTISETESPAGYNGLSTSWDSIKFSVQKVINQQTGKYDVGNITLLSPTNDKQALVLPYDKNQDEKNHDYTYTAGWDMDGNLTTDISKCIVAINLANTSKIEVTWSNPKFLQGSYNMNITKKKRENEGENIEGAKFNINQWINNHDTEKAPTSSVNVEVNTEKTPIKFNDDENGGLVKISNESAVDTYTISEIEAPDGYVIFPNWNVKIHVHKKIEEITSENGENIKKYTVNFLTISKGNDSYTKAFRYDVGLEEGTVQVGDSNFKIYKNTIKIDADGNEVAHDEDTSNDNNYVLEIGVEKNENAGDSGADVSINLTWTNIESGIYSLNMLKKDSKTYNYGKNSQTESKRNIIEMNNQLEDAEYRVVQYKDGINGIDDLATKYSNDTWNEASETKSIKVTKTEYTPYKNVDMPEPDEVTGESSPKHYYIIEETKAPKGYQLNNTIYVLEVEFEQDESNSKVKIKNITENRLLKTEEGTLKKQDNSNETTNGTNEDKSKYIISSDENNKYRIDYSGDTIVFTAPDDKTTGSYDLDLIKNDTFNLNPIEGLESLKSKVAGAEYEVTQYLNVDVYDNNVRANFEKFYIGTKITVGTRISEDNENEIELYNCKTGKKLDYVFQNVPITNTNTVDIYKVKEIKAPMGYTINKTTQYIQVAKEELNKEEGKKEFAIKLDEYENAETTMEYSDEVKEYERSYYSMRTFYTYSINGNNYTSYNSYYRKKDGARVINKDSSRYVYNAQGKCRVDYNTHKIVITLTDEIKTGDFNFDIKKIDEFGKTIQNDENNKAKFKINIYSSEETTQEGTFVYRDEVNNLIDSKNKNLKQDNLPVSEFTFEKIPISTDMIGKIYYIMIEETTPPEGFEKLDYKILIPIEFHDLTHLTAALLSNEAVALKEQVDLDGNISYKKESFENVKVGTRTVNVDITGKTINLVIPNHQTPTGKYNINLRKVKLNDEGKVTDSKVSGVAFTVQDKNEEILLNNQFTNKDGILNIASDVGIVEENQVDEYIITEMQVPDILKEIKYHNIKVTVPTKHSDNESENSYEVDKDKVKFEVVFKDYLKDKEQDEKTKAEIKAEKEFLQEHTSIEKTEDENGTTTISITIPNEQNVLFDLALRKWIVNDLTDSSDEVIKGDLRAPTQFIKNNPDTALAAECMVKGTLEYDNPKNAIEVKRGSIVKYRIGIFNEGNINGYAEEVTDYLPKGLTLVPADKSEVNKKYGWEVDEEKTNELGDGQTAIKTTYLARFDEDGSEKSNETSVKTATTVGGIEQSEGETYNKNCLVRILEYAAAQGAGEEAEKVSCYKILEVECQVSNDVESETYLTNRAEITKYGYYTSEDQSSFVEVKKENVDLDSVEDTINDTDGLGLDDWYEKTYLEHQDQDNYPGEEDDDDFETVVVKQPEFDLALRKWIKVDDEDSRAPTQFIKDKPDVSLASECMVEGTLKYNNPKNAIEVKKGDTVTYRIGIFNEGSMEGYAEEVTDYLPAELEFDTESDKNKQYGWEVDNAATSERNDGVTVVRTKHLARFDENGKEESNESKNETSNDAKQSEGKTYNKNCIVTILEHVAGEVVNGEGADCYKILEIECKVKEDALADTYITNRAEITKYGYYTTEDKDSFVETTKEGVDIDSEENTIKGSLDLDNWYKKTYLNEEEKDNYPGVQDDDDFDTVIVKEEKHPSMQIALNKLGKSQENIEGAKFRVNEYVATGYMNTDIQITVLNRNEVRLANEGVTFVIPKEGIIIDMQNIEQGKDYYLKITEVEAPKKYNKSLNYLILKVRLDENNEVIANIEQVVDSQGKVIENQNIAKIRESENNTPNVEPNHGLGGSDGQDQEIGESDDQNHGLGGSDENSNISTNTEVLDVISNLNTKPISLQYIAKVWAGTTGLKSIR